MLSHPKNIKLIWPITKVDPTTTFQNNKGLGLGLNFPITKPDDINPKTIPNSVIGPV